MDIRKLTEKAFQRNMSDPSVLEDAFECCRLLEEEDFALAHKLNKEVKRYAASQAKMYGSTQMFDLYRRNLLFDARSEFDSYCQYLEWNREPEKKFYLPRRKILKPLVDDLQDLFDGRLDFLGISLPPRVGKLVSDDTPVLTANGWKNHGDLAVGDKVIAPTGEFVRVTYVFPKDYANIRVHFTDGTHADVHENHEWVVYNRRKQRIEKLETREMMADFETGVPGKRGHRYHYQLPFKVFVKGEVQDLPVPAYTLGAWLGGCGDKADGQKHIPQEYLIAPVGQRLALLAGLLDSDGSLRRKERRYDFSTTEPTLRDDFVSLISTFGWRCSVAEHEPSRTSSGIEGKRTYWIISFNPTCYIPCQLERKQLHDFSKPRRVAICGFERIAPKQGNCISVEGGLYCIGKRLIPTHNSTLCIFFMTWVMGNRPDVASVMSGHSDKLTDGFYRELLSIITDKETYRWKDVFPDVILVNNSAKNETIDLNKEKRFPTMTCRSISGTLTGAVEIGSGGVLYCDDLIEDLEESLNPLRLQAKYDAYLNQLKDRKKLGAVELMVGTRWNVMDPLGRVKEQYEGNDRYRFRVIPALNEDGESNFNYKYNLGFDTEYYRDMKESIDDATWNAKYQGTPYVREGLLFPEDELRTYNGVLPDGDPMRIAVCDVAWGGGDSLSMPFAYIYGDDVYIHDVIFNKGDKNVTYPIVIGRCKQHMPHRVRFEANNGGSEYADHVDSSLRSENVRINISSQKAPNTQSKLARIIQMAPDIKRFYFLDEKHRNKEYSAFMKELTTFVQTGKNLHDDSPDSLGQLADELFRGGTKAEVFKRPY